AYSFTDLVILLRSPKALEALEAELAQRSPDSPRLLEYRLFLDRYREPDRSGRSILNAAKLRDMFGGISGRLHAFASGKFGQVLNSYAPEVELFEAMRDNRIVYGMLPTMGKHEQANGLGKLVVGDLRTAISWLQELPGRDAALPF